MQKIPFLILGLVTLFVSTAVNAAQNRPGETRIFQVPVTLRNILPTVETIHVQCTVRARRTNTEISGETVLQLDEQSRDSFNKKVQVSVTISRGRRSTPLDQFSDYKCQLRFRNADSWPHLREFVDFPAEYLNDPFRTSTHTPELDFYAVHFGTEAEAHPARLGNLNLHLDRDRGYMLVPALAYRPLNRQRWMAGAPHQVPALGVQGAHFKHDTNGTGAVITSSSNSEQKFLRFTVPLVYSDLPEEVEGLNVHCSVHSYNRAGSRTEYEGKAYFAATEVVRTTDKGVGEGEGIVDIPVGVPLPMKHNIRRIKSYSCWLTIRDAQMEERPINEQDGPNWAKNFTTDWPGTSRTITIWEELLREPAIKTEIITFVGFPAL